MNIFIKPKRFYFFMINDIVEVAKEIANIKLNPDNYKLGEEFLKNAEDDLEVSKCLYEKEKFSLSIYHLQQSVEKTVKAGGLIFNLIPPEQLKKIGHKTPLTFLKMLEKPWVIKFVKIAKENYPDLKTNTTEAEETIHNKHLEIAKWKKDSILNFINLPKKLKEQVELESAKNPSISQLIKIFNQFSNRDFREVVEFASSFVTLYLLSAITFPHEEFTRYPTICPDKGIKPSDYQKGLGIVDSAPEIFAELENSILSLRRYTQC